MKSKNSDIVKNIIKVYCYNKMRNIVWNNNQAKVYMTTSCIVTVYFPFLRLHSINDCIRPYVLCGWEDRNFLNKAFFQLTNEGITIHDP